MPDTGCRVAVGSRNPVKIAAVRGAWARMRRTAEFLPFAAESGVGGQPASDAETIQGALNRARAALAQGKADIGVGLEGGVADTEYGMFLTSWAAVVGADDRQAMGCGGSLLLPQPIARQIRAGAELGPVMDEMTGAENLKEGQGAVGVLTQGLISRQEVFERAVLFAASGLNAA